MAWTSWLAIYFVVWWLVLFTTLPFGVRNVEEAGEEPVEGADTGAPVKPMLGRKLLATTIISAVIVGGVNLLVLYDIVDFRTYFAGK